MMKSPFLDFLGDIRTKLGWRAFALILALIANSFAEGFGLALLFPLLAKLGVEGNANNSLIKSIDSVFNFLGLPTGLIGVLGLIMGAFIIQNGIFLFQSYLSAHCQSSYANKWRTALFDSIMHAPWRFFSKQHSGVLTNAIIRETPRLAGAFFLTVQLGIAISMVCIYLMIAMLSSWKAALILMIFGCVLFLATRPLIRVGRNIGAELTQQNEKLQCLISEFFYNAKLLKATASEEFSVNLFNPVSEAMAKTEILSSFHPNLLKAIYEMSGVIVLCFVLGVSLLFLKIDSASVIVTVYLFVRLYSRLSIIPQHLQMLNLHLPSLEKVKALFNQAVSEREYQRTGVLLTSKRGVGISFEDVSIRYDSEPVLQDISLEIKKGSIIGIVGVSGSGKTTLVDSLLDLIEPQKGKIQIEGISLNRLDVKQWRKNIGYVPQETQLFNTSVFENIAWGNTGVTEDMVKAAAQHANAHEFIHTLPEGYHTTIGERGLRLSGGQRQRLGLARALVDEKQLIILDEATSALDSPSETLIMDAIYKLKDKMTVIIIAHRLSSLMQVDKIYIINEGKIVEQGTWHELLDSNTEFKAMWEMQSQVKAHNRAEGG